MGQEKACVSSRLGWRRFWVSQESKDEKLSKGLDKGTSCSSVKARDQQTTVCEELGSTEGAWRSDQSQLICPRRLRFRCLPVGPSAKGRWLWRFYGAAPTSECSVNGFPWMGLANEWLAIIAAVTRASSDKLRQRARYVQSVPTHCTKHR